MCINKNTDQDRFTFENLSLAIIKKQEILGVNIEDSISISQFQLQFQNSISMMMQKLFVEKMVRKLVISPEQLGILKMVKEGSCLIVWLDRNSVTVQKFGYFLRKNQTTS